MIDLERGGRRRRFDTGFHTRVFRYAATRRRRTTTVSKPNALMRARGERRWLNTKVYEVKIDSQFSQRIEIPSTFIIHRGGSIRSKPFQGWSPPKKKEKKERKGNTHTHGGGFGNGSISRPSHFL
jgi:hypothetical protein